MYMYLYMCLCILHMFAHLHKYYYVYMYISICFLYARQSCASHVLCKPSVFLILHYKFCYRLQTARRHIHIHIISNPNTLRRDSCKRRLDETVIQLNNPVR